MNGVRTISDPPLRFTYDSEKGDMIIYGCVIIGAGIGLLIDQPLPAVCVGLGTGYLIKHALYRE